jgi:hypothetical protein
MRTCPWSQENYDHRQPKPSTSFCYSANELHMIERGMSGLQEGIVVSAKLDATDASFPTLSDRHHRICVLVRVAVFPNWFLIRGVDQARRQAFYHGDLLTRTY